MLTIENGNIIKSGVYIDNKNILKHIDESVFVKKDNVLKKEISLEELRNVLINYPLLVEEFKYLDELIIRGSVLKEDDVKDVIVESMFRCVEHIPNGKKIDNLYMRVNGEEYSSTTFMKLKDIYRVPIVFGLNREYGFDFVNDIEVILKEYDDDVSLNDLLSTINIEIDFMDDDEIDFYKNKVN